MSKANVSCLLGAAVLAAVAGGPGCNASSSDDPDGACEQALRELLPLWHSQVKADLKRSDGDDGRSAVQAEMWAESTVAVAHLRYRTYGGDSARNEANARDSRSAARMAVDASEVALKLAPDPGKRLEAAVAAATNACAGESE